MTTTLYIATLITVAFIAYIYGTSNNATTLKEENRKLQHAYNIHLNNINTTNTWIRKQFHHSNMFNIAIQNMRDVSIRYQRGELTANEAELEYELYRAEGQIHFDALDKETQHWYVSELEEMGIGNYLQTH